MKNKALKISLFTITLAIGVALFVWVFINTGAEKTLLSLSNFGAIPFIGFVLISLANFGLLSHRWQIIINRHSEYGNHVPFWNIARHRMSGFAMSYLTPSAQIGGEPLRIALLTNDGVPLRVATSSVVLDIVFEITGMILFISIGLFISLWQGILPQKTEWIVGITLLAAAVLMTVFFFSIVTRRGFFSSIFRFICPKKFKWLCKIEFAILDVEKLMRRFLHANPWVTLNMLAISFITIAFRAVEVFYLAFFLGTNLTLVQAILLSTLPGLAMFIPIPSGLGVLEGSTAAIVTTLGISLNAVALVLIIRMRDVLFVTLGTFHVGQSVREWVRRKVPKRLQR